MQATNINEVITILDDIIEQSIQNKDPLGYFAVLYRKVTVKVKESIGDHFFDDNERMEKLDVVFANRFLAAYFAFQKRLPTTNSWKRAFDLSRTFWPITLQHLLVGINAHISLDLGIAAAEISQGKPIEALKDDFDKINEVLAALVNDVQNDLARIWPTLTIILKFTKKLDDLLINFSMELVRNDAWKLAVELAKSPKDDWETLIKTRDERVARQADVIAYPGLLPKIVLGVVRIGERGSVDRKITYLQT